MIAVPRDTCTSSTHHPVLIAYDWEWIWLPRTHDKCNCVVLCGDRPLLAPPRPVDCVEYSCNVSKPCMKRESIKYE